MKNQLNQVAKGKIFIILLAVAIIGLTASSYKALYDTGKHSIVNKLKHPAISTDFRIAVIPDIQHYTGHLKLAIPAMWQAQIKWIKQNHVDSNIVYVAGMGDTVDDLKIDSVYDTDAQWKNAALNGGYYALETPAPGIAYGVAVGNHDEADFAFDRDTQVGSHHNHPGISPVRNTTAKYNEYFGVEHFKNKPWYGGHANILGKNNNDCHYDKFTVAGQKYIVVFIAFDNEGAGPEDKDGLMVKWAHSVIKANADAKAIVVSHSILKGPKEGIFSPQGLTIYNAVKDLPNVFLMLCGHVTGEYMRQDVYQGHTIKSYLIDCQALPKGGDGRMRTMRINTVTDSISINTFSPYSGKAY
jgi:hypothetical protein